MGGLVAVAFIKWINKLHTLFKVSCMHSGGFRGGSKGSMEPPFWLQ